jgi:hypothetical protein
MLDLIFCLLKLVSSTDFNDSKRKRNKSISDLKNKHIDQHNPVNFSRDSTENKKAKTIFLDSFDSKKINDDELNRMKDDFLHDLNDTSLRLNISDINTENNLSINSNNNSNESGSDLAYLSSEIRQHTSEEPENPNKLYQFTLQQANNYINQYANNRHHGSYTNWQPSNYNTSRMDNTKINTFHIINNPQIQHNSHQSVQLDQSQNTVNFILTEKPIDLFFPESGFLNCVINVFKSAISHNKFHRFFISVDFEIANTDPAQFSLEKITKASFFWSGTKNYTKYQVQLNIFKDQAVLICHSRAF